MLPQLFQFTFILFTPEIIMVLNGELIGSTCFNKEKNHGITCLCEKDLLEISLLRRDDSTD